MTATPRCLLIMTCLVAALTALPGCNPADSTEPPTEAPPVDELKREIDEVLQFTFDDRHLSVDRHAAWQILHGVLAYGPDFPVLVDGMPRPTVEYLLSGGEMRGWTVRPGDRIPWHEDRVGLRAILDVGSRAGQGHPDQWLAVLSQCNLPGETEIKVGEQTFTVHDFVSQVMWDVPHVKDQEYSWTLIALSRYLDSDQKWTASDGQTWSLERLVDIESSHPLGSSACGGTHQLIGLTMALDSHDQQGGQPTGAWKKALDKIHEAIVTAQQYQNPDGSFSSNYFTAPGNSPDAADSIGTTGHTLEFLTLALDRQTLVEPWIRRAVAYLCDVFRKTKDVDIECGKLYHAAHALVLYREKVYGPKSYGP